MDKCVRRIFRGHTKKKKKINRLLRNSKPGVTWGPLESQAGAILTGSARGTWRGRVC